MKLNEIMFSPKFRSSGTRGETIIPYTIACHALKFCGIVRTIAFAKNDLKIMMSGAG